jgi:EAL domain-containing protein (putative c-di-GMP-specific phosphodiesterase class I)
MQNAPAGTPWLEYFQQQGGPVQKTLLTSFPFSIGRNDTTDLPINSTRVSREHAAIVRAGNTYRVRDLDSTNGTYVNGQRIEEATLSDGDLVVIADVEFTFFSGLAQGPRKTVTQVIGFREADSTTLKSSDVVRSLRRLQETALQGSSCVGRRDVTELSSAKVVGYEVFPRSGQPRSDTTEIDRRVLAAQSRLSLRLREMFCLAATDAIAGSRGLKLFLPLETSDLDPGIVEQYVDLLAGVVPQLSDVVLEFPDGSVNDISYFHDLHRRLKARGVLLCYSDFAAGKAQVEVHKKVPPNFVKLARTLTRSVLQEASRQTQLEAMVADCRRIGCEVIVPDVESGRSAQLFGRLGCRFAIAGSCDSASEVSPPPKDDAKCRAPSREASALAAVSS